MNDRDTGTPVGSVGDTTTENLRCTSTAITLTHGLTEVRCPTLLSSPPCRHKGVRVRFLRKL